MLQNIVKRSMFLHAYIQTAKKPSIFNVFLPFGCFKKDKLNLECI